jgi:hypothetical protein
MKKSTVVSLSLLVGVLSANAELHTQTIEYKQGDTVLEGFLAYDKAIRGKRPGVLIVHQWKGLGSYEKKRAEMLANLGYTVFALDIYGKGIRADNPKEASALAAKYKNDRALLRERAKSGLGILKKHELTDPERIAAIGFTSSARRQRGGVLLPPRWRLPRSAQFPRETTAGSAASSAAPFP